MPLRNANMMKSVVGADVLNLRADVGKSFLVKDIHIKDVSRIFPC